MWKKVMLSFTAIMWILAIGQLLFVDKADSMRARQEVFHTISKEDASYEVSVLGSYKGEFLTREEEKAFLNQCTERIGFPSGEILSTDNHEGHITYLTINGDAITGYGKIITKERIESKQSIASKQYVCFDFTSKEKEGMEQLRDTLEQMTKQEKINAIPVYSAEYESKEPLSKEEQKKLITSLAEAMGGTILSNFTQDGMRYAYGYSRGYSYSQKIDGINLNFLIYLKPSDAGRTRVHVQYPTVSLK